MALLEDYQRNDRFSQAVRSTHLPLRPVVCRFVAKTKDLKLDQGAGLPITTVLVLNDCAEQNATWAFRFTGGRQPVREFCPDSMKSLVQAVRYNSELLINSDKSAFRSYIFSNHSR